MVNLFAQLWLKFNPLFLFAYFKFYVFPLKLDCKRKIRKESDPGKNDEKIFSSLRVIVWKTSRQLAISSDVEGGRCS